MSVPQQFQSDELLQSFGNIALQFEGRFWRGDRHRVELSLDGLGDGWVTVAEVGLEACGELILKL